MRHHAITLSVAVVAAFTAGLCFSSLAEHVVSDAHAGSIVASGPVKALAIKLPPQPANDTVFVN